MHCKVFLDREGPTAQKSLISDRGKKKHDGSTFLHSGESVRPQVLQIYCSPPTDFLSWERAMSGATRD